MNSHLTPWKSNLSDREALLYGIRLVAYGFRDIFVGLCHLLWALGRMLWCFLKAIAWGIWRGLQGFGQGVKDILNASNPRDE